MKVQRSDRSTAFWVSGVACAALLLGCQSTAPGPKDPYGGSSSSGPVSATPAPPPIVVPRESEIPGLLTAVRNNLDAGDAAAATADLERILAFDPQQRAAASLMRQLREDPNELYGRESFSYRVQGGDTLATIAQRFLNDRDQFYGLARYNGIDVPRQLQVGQTIRIPGKQPRVMPPPVSQPAPAPSAPPAPPPAPAPAPVPPPAPAPAPAPAVVAPDPRLEQARLESERRNAIAKNTRQARAAMARQDVCGAIAAWNEVLRLDPANRTAALEREKALDLKKRLPAAKC